MTAAVAAPPTWTVRALLSWTTDYLTQKKCESPRLDAQVLLAHVLQCPRIELVARYDEEPTGKQRSIFREFVTKRVEGWPVAYLIGEREFYLLKFAVSPAVLIPRPDTETLVMEALNRLKTMPQANVLDIGTGSGCIAISLAKQSATTRVTAVDISPDAVEVAQANARKHGVEDRVTLLVGDLFGPVAKKKFHMVVSNPPYITTAEMNELAPEVKDHEPRVALDGGTDGLAFYRRLAAGVAEYLEPNGMVMCEIGHTQADAVSAEFTAKGFVVEPVIKDAGRKPRVIVARRG